MKLLIVDDEESARILVKKYLENVAEIEWIKEAENGFEAFKIIKEDKPDALILDINMPKISGFELLEMLDEKPKFIFSTAYDEFAIKAFEHNAIDYLLKPYSKIRLLEAIDKAKIISDLQVTKLSKTQSEKEYLDRLVLKNGSQLKLISIKDVLYFKAEDDYVRIVHTEGEHLKNTTLSNFEDRISPSDFIRVHRSYILPIKSIKKIEAYTKDSYLAILTNGEKIPVSKAGYKLIRNQISV